MNELRAAVDAALKRMESAHEALLNVGEDADVEALERDFDQAEADHKAAVTRLERAQRVAEARENAPVALEEEQPEQEQRQAGETRVVSESLTYERGNGQSFVRDAFNATARGEISARQRLDRHMQEMRVERRDLTEATDSDGGYLVAPLYLQNEFIEFDRAGRVIADVIGPRPLPPNTNSIHIPKQDGGVTVDTQSTENTALSETDATFTEVVADVKTVGGIQDVSQQLVDRGVPGIDGIIFADLRRAYNVKLDEKVINSSDSNNEGLLQADNVNAVTYTDASPTAAELYKKVADAIQQIHTGLYMAPNAIFMHPRRWAFLLAEADTAGRPLVVPSAQAPQNAVATQSGVVAQGAVGTMQGLPVYTDPNIPGNLGAGTNEDRIIIAHTPDLLLWEAPGGPFLDTFREPGSDTLTVRFRLFNYWAQQHERKPEALAVISGTGLITPTFA